MARFDKCRERNLDLLQFVRMLRSRVPVTWVGLAAILPCALLGCGTSPQLPNDTTPAVQSIGPTRALPTLTVTAGLDRTPTILPTVTATPTALPSATGTATLPATLTPATPPPDGQVGWQLVPWTAAEADRLIAQEASRLEALLDDPLYGSTYGYELWLGQHAYLVDLEQEALLRFPDATQAERWRWDLAYHQGLAFTSPAAPDAPELASYRTLIAVALNSGEATLDTLQTWLTTRDPRLSFAVVGLEPPTSVDASALVEIDQLAFLWVGQHGSTYDVYGLLSNLAYFREASGRHDILDVTGDGFPELVLSYSQGTCCGFYSEYALYTLDCGWPERLRIVGPDQTRPSLITMSGGTLTALTAGENDGRPGLAFEATEGDPYLEPCRVRRIDRYAWNGMVLEWQSRSYAVLPPGSGDDRSLCQWASTVGHSPDEVRVVALALAHAYEVGGRETLPLRVRFRLGEFLLRHGQVARAKALLEELLEQPVSVSPEVELPWRDGAQTLLESIAGGQPFDEVCQRMALCDRNALLAERVAAMPVVQAPQLAASLSAAGFDVRGFGQLSGSATGQPVWWLVVRDALTGQRAFWLVAIATDRLVANAVSMVLVDQPSVTVYSDVAGQTRLTIDASEGPILVELHVAQPGAPWVFVSSARTSTASSTDRATAEMDFVLDRLTRDLLAGEAPGPIRDILQGLRNNLSCPTNPMCVRTDYLLGLSSDLLGEEAAAVEAYLRAWRAAPDSPTALWIRMRLRQYP